MGNTRILEALKNDKEIESDAKLAFSVRSEATTPAEFIQSLSTQLIEADILEPASFAEYLVEMKKKPIKNGYKIGLAFVSDIVSAKLSQGKGTINTLAEIVSEADLEAAGDARAQELSNAAKDDIILAFQELLSIADNSGSNGVIFLDGLENCSIPMVNSVKALSTNLPPSWKMVMAINTERIAGIPIYNSLIETVSYLEGKSIEISALMDVDIEQWMLEYNLVDRSAAEISAAIVVTGGRSYFLKQWLEGVSLEDISLMIGQKLAPTYSARFGSLSPPAKALLSRMALLPNALAWDANVRAILGHGIPDFNMAAHFIQSFPDGNVGLHDETKQQISSIVSDVREPLALELLDVLDQKIPNWGSEFQYEQLLLLDYSGKKEGISSQANILSSQLAKTRPFSADVAATVALENQRNNSLLYQETLVNQAEAKVALSFYDDAQTLLNEVDPEINSLNLKFRSKMLALKIFLRKNEYQ